MNDLQPGAPARKKLDTLQQQIAATRKEMRDIERAEPALEDLRLTVRASIARKASEDDWVFLGGESLPELPGGGVPWGALIALIGPKEVEERIVAIRSAEKIERGLPAAKRAAKLSELQTKLDDLERREELEVLELEEAGHEILRRGDADARVLLDIWQSKSQPTQGSLQSSKEGQSTVSEYGESLNANAPLHAPPRT